jgi:hypothetical protein
MRDIESLLSFSQLAFQLTDKSLPIFFWVLTLGTSCRPLRSGGTETCFASCKSEKLDFESQGAAKTSFSHLAKNLQAALTLYFKTTLSKWMKDQIKKALN